MNNFVSKLKGFFSTESFESGFIDQSLGRMNREDVLDLIIPIATKAKYISKNENASFDIREIGLFQLSNKLIWIINFEWLAPNTNDSATYIDNFIATIKVDDETGKIISIWQKGMSEEVSYSEFLKILNKNRHLDD